MNPVLSGSRDHGVLAAAALALALVVAGCASSGARIGPAQLAELKPGTTTFDEISRRFGRPNFLSNNWDGTQTAAYAYAEGSSDAALTLPALGAALAGTGGGADSVVFYFDRKGVLTGFKAAGAAAKPDTPVAAAPVASPSRGTEPPAARPVDTAGAKSPAAAGTVKPAPSALQEPRKRAPGELPSWLPSSSSRGERY